MLATNDSKNYLITPTKFILIYFIFFSAGIIKLTSLLSVALYNHIDIAALLAGSNEWIESFNSNKLQSLIQYSLSLVSLLLLYWFCFLFFINERWQNKLFFLA